MEIKNYLIIGLFFGIVSCDYPVNPDHDLTFIKTPYLGNQLRTGGYWITTSSNFEGPLYRFMFFYRNGVWRNGGASQDRYGYISNGWLPDGGRIIWGYFIVQGATLEFEQWTPESTWIYQAAILNDSTFRVNRYRDSKGFNWRNEEETFHFVKFFPKPDSTSRFID